MSDKMTQVIATGFAGISLVVAGAVFSPVYAAQQLSCKGSKPNGWNYDAQFVDGRFTQVTWTRSGQPPRVSPMKFDRTNSQGQPVYRGSFQGATAVTLVDLGQGNVRPGSQISVGVEEWGWSRGTCGVASGGSTDWLTNLRQTVINNERWRESMQAQGFVFVQTMSQTNTQFVERWMRMSDRATVDVVITNNRATDVRRVN